MKNKTVLRHLSSVLAALLLALTIAIPVSSFTGCALIKPADGIQPNALIKVTTMLGTKAALVKHPESRPAFQIAATELYTMEQQNEISFNTLLGILSRLPVKELSGDDATLYIMAGTILLEGVAIGQVDLSKTPELRSAIIGLRQGIELGLGNNPSPTLRTFAPVPPPSVIPK